MHFCYQWIPHIFLFQLISYLRIFKQRIWQETRQHLHENRSTSSVSRSKTKRCTLGAHQSVPEWVIFFLDDILYSLINLRPENVRKSRFKICRKLGYWPLLNPDSGCVQRRHRSACAIYQGGAIAYMEMGCVRGKASSNMLTGGAKPPQSSAWPPQSGQKVTTGGAGNSQKANEFLGRGVSAHKSKCVNETWMQCEHIDT